MNIFLGMPIMRYYQYRLSREKIQHDLLREENDTALSDYFDIPDNPLILSAQ